MWHLTSIMMCLLFDFACRFIEVKARSSVDDNLTVANPPGPIPPHVLGQCCC